MPPNGRDTPTLLKRLLHRAAAWGALASLLFSLALPALDHHAAERNPAHGHGAASAAVGGLPHHHAFEYPHEHPPVMADAGAPAGAPAGAAGALVVVLVEPHEHGAPSPGPGGSAALPTQGAGAPGGGSSWVPLCAGGAPAGRTLLVGVPPPQPVLV